MDLAGETKRCVDDMTLGIKPHHVKLLSVDLDYMELFGKDYLIMSVEALRTAYNKAMKINISIRSIYYYQARLKEFNMIIKKPRRLPATTYGARWQSSLTFITKAGLFQLFRDGKDAFNRIKKIKAVMTATKKESSRESAREDSKGSMKPIAEVIGKTMENLKPQ